MDIAFHLYPAKTVGFQSKGRVERRMLGLLRSSGDFRHGPIRVYGGVFSNWIFQRYLPPGGNLQDHYQMIQQAELSCRNRLQKEAVKGWFWLGDSALIDIAQATDFLMVRNLSTQVADLICYGMEKRAYLQCAFEVSRRSDIQNAIYYQLGIL